MEKAISTTRPTRTVAIRFSVLALRIAVVGLIVAIAWIYMWIASAGKVFEQWPSYTSYYTILADAFLHGQTHLLIGPQPELLALPDPYDPAQNGPYRLHDALLYNGKYYLYWGPVPALLLTIVKLVFGVGVVEDQYIVFVALSGLLIMSTLLIMLLRARLFPSLSHWLVVPAVLLIGLVNPLPFLLGRAAVYEAAISSGQFFLIGGLYWVISALTAKRPILWRLVLAGIFLACTVGSRVSLVLAVIALVPLIAWRIFALASGPQQLRRVFPALLAFGLPLLVGALLLAAYNYLRFGSWSEFGMRYQLAGINMPQVTANTFISADYVWPGLYFYILRQLSYDRFFPFVKPESGIAGAENLVEGLPLYMVEPVTGVLFALPLIWALVLLLSLFLPWTRRVLRTDQEALAPQNVPATVWVTLCLFVTTILCLLPTLFLLGATMRYLADWIPTATILVLLGTWLGLRLIPQHAVWQGLWNTMSIFAITFSALVGFLFGVQGYSGHLEINNAQLFDRIRYLTLPAGLFQNTPQAVLVAIHNSIGLNKSPDGVIGFWLNSTPTHIEVIATEPGIVKAEALFWPGPSIPERTERTMSISSSDGYSHTLYFTPNYLTQTLELPVKAGLNIFALEALDPPTLLQMPNGDARPMVIGVAGLQVMMSEKLIILDEINNPNGVDLVEGEPFYWLNHEPTVIQLLSSRNGQAELSAEFVNGPNATPSLVNRRLLVTTNTGYQQTILIDGGQHTISVPVQIGITTVTLLPLDRPIKTGGPDPRILILGMRHLDVAFASLNRETTP